MMNEGNSSGLNREKTIIYYLSTKGYPPEEKERRLAFMAQYLPAGYRVKFVVNQSGPEFLDQEKDFSEAVGSAVTDIQQIGKKQGDIIILGGALDPGIHDLRARAQLPIVAPGESALFVAAILGLPTSILVQDDAAIQAGHQLSVQSLNKPEIASIRSIGISVRNLTRDLQSGKEFLIKAARKSISEDHAKAILLGSMTLPTLGITELLRDELDVPVFDPLRIAIRTCIEALESISSSEKS